MKTDLMKSGFSYFKIFLLKVYKKCTVPGKVVQLIWMESLQRRNKKALSETLFFHKIETKIFFDIR